MPKDDYIQISIHEFKRMKGLADNAFAQITSEQFFATLSKDDNSIAVIVKHVAGNLLSRWTDFLAADGEKPGRSRDSEFEILPTDTRQVLMRQWESGWAVLFSALEPLTDDDLERTITIRGEPLSVLLAINRQIAHYSYHVGQIVYIAKHHAASAWQCLSIPRGKSAQFNANPTKYVQRV
jgi:hypothetical protein